MSSRPTAPTLGLLVGVLALGATTPAAQATPLATAGLGAASPVLVSDHHRPLRHRHAPLARQAPVVAPDTVPPGGYADPRVNNSSSSQFAPNDPERPFGAYSTVTAPPGTAAAEEQENNRRYYCNFAPEHC